MHPVIMRQLAADHISETHTRAEDERRAREARRGGGLYENGSALDDVRAGLGEKDEELADDQGKGEDPLLSSFNI